MVAKKKIGRMQSSAAAEHADQQAPVEERDESSECSSPVESASAAKLSRGHAIDLTTMQHDGLLTSDEAQEYLAYRQIVEYAQKYGRFNKFQHDISIYCFEKINVFCIYLLLPEAYSKLMKDWIMKPRSIIKTLKPNNVENPNLTSAHALILKESEDMVETIAIQVSETMDKLVQRVAEEYRKLSPELVDKYESRFQMVTASLRKINADFQRYRAEMLSGEQRLKVAELAKISYEQAFEGFLKLPYGIKGPQALSCQLNYSVLLCDVFNRVDEAIECAENVLRKVGETIMPNEINNAVTFSLLQVIKENLTQWYCGRDEKNLYESSSEGNDEEDESKDSQQGAREDAPTKTPSRPLEKSKTIAN